MQFNPVFFFFLPSMFYFPHLYVIAHSLKMKIHCVILPVSINFTPVLPVLSEKNVAPRQGFQTDGLLIHQTASQESSFLTGTNKGWKRHFQMQKLNSLFNVDVFPAYCCKN